MASDHSGGTAISVTLPESLSDWLDDVAHEEGLSREDVLLQLLSAYRRVDGDAAGVPVDGDGTADAAVREGTLDQPDDAAAELAAELRADVESMVAEQLAEREDAGADVDAEQIEADIRTDLEDAFVDVEEFDDRFADVEARFGDLLEDVRERVVQVKRETDGKAPAEHDHPALDSRLDDLGEDLDRLETAIEVVDGRLDDGFDNFEAVLEYLTDSVDELSARQTTLARALVETRDEVRRLASHEAARASADELRRTANASGVRTATCEDCDESVDVGLLSRAECPHCAATFEDVEPASGFFGTATLLTGPDDPPALEPGHEDDDAGFEFGVTEIIESDSPTAGVDHGDAGESGASARDDDGDGDA